MGSDNLFYVTLLSNGSQTLYPDNTVGAFTTELAQTIELNFDFRRIVSSCKFICPTVSADGWSVNGDYIGLIYCDLVSPQTIESALARCLRSFTFTLVQPCEFFFDNTYYMPVECTAAFKHTCIEIMILAGERVPFESSVKPPRLVLYFRRYRLWD
jgi:hypothetical protein